MVHLRRSIPYWAISSLLELLTISFFLVNHAEIRRRYFRRRIILKSFKTSLMTNRITLQDYFKLFLISILLLPLFTLAGNYPPGEPKIITGLVLSQTDQSPVAGASVVVKGSKV